MIINNHMKNLLNPTVVTSIKDLIRGSRKLYGFVETLEQLDFVCANGQGNA